jgi:two-component system chemotaxis sensor kinase CheA
MDDFESELKNDFLQEAKELMASTEKSFLTLENEPNNLALVDAIFRFAHNLKGTSRAVGFGQIAELTHVAENLLLDIKQGKLVVNDQVVSILLTFNDKVREMLDGLSANLEATFEFSDLMVELETVRNGTNAASSAANLEIKTETPAETHTEAQTIDEMENVSIEKDFETQKAPEPKIKVEVKKEIKKDPKKDDETIRVSINRLDKLNDMAGELVILQSLVEVSLQKNGDTKLARSFSKLCSSIQDLALSLRMVPVGPSFQKLTRVVRDTSKLLGKKIDLKLIGEDTELDKTVAESLGDPLVHIIRNAIDHGVELPEDRIKNGKEETGVVEVMAFHEGNFLVIQITDDGKGIDGDKLIEKAKTKGIIPSNAKLTTQQGVELIFHAGFSTKEEVSEVSGRGVGMDVVKTNIEALGGEVRVRSVIGKGSSFRLMLPLTLAIIEGMLVKSHNQHFVIPKNQIQEVVNLEKNSISRHTGRNPYYKLRGNVMPLFYLSGDLGIEHKNEDNIALIIKDRNSIFAVGISDIIRQQQVVVKPATKEIFGKQGIMGTTILGSGMPAIIVDLFDLYSKKVKNEGTQVA